MAYDVEDKVVQMRFDNREFDPNIDASIKSLEKLERSLQLADGTKGLQNIEKSAKNFNLNPAVTAVESLKNGFSAMEVVAITAISNITNRAMAMGHQLINAFAIAPVKSGFAEYSEQMNSTQVIMSNLTDTTLPEVTAALDVLNEYADRTIYSFGQMTQAIGKFAAAGVDLGPATKAIQGLSSAAATVGANNQQLFSAYYNLAQSLQLGYMQLIDWKSLENSTIGNKTMRKAFVDTAIQMRKFTKDSEQAKKAYSDFRGSLQSKWLTTDVIIETLQKYSRQIKEIEGAYYEVNAAGKPVSEAFKEIRNDAGEVTGYITDTYGTLEAWEVELASTAFKAATEVKSFKQMWETLTEAAGTGWAETWKIIFGDLEQAKHLWTEVSKPIEKVISVFNEVRNTALEAWAALGGREDLQATLINLSNAFGTLGDTIKMTIDKIFGTTTIVVDKATGATRTVSNLYLEFLKATRVLKIFSEYLIMSNDEIEQVSDSLATLLKPLRIVGKVLSFVGKAILSIIVMGVAIVQTIIDIAANLDIIPEIIDSIFGAGSWDRFLETLALVLNVVGNLAGLFFDLGTMIVHALGMAFDFIRNLLAGFLGVEAQSLHFANVFEFIGNAILFAINAVNNFITALREIIRAFDAFFKGDISSLGEAFGVARGTNFVQGVIIGAQNMAKPLAKIGSKLGLVLSSAFDKVLGIQSPSRVGKKSGRYYPEGIYEGVEEGKKEVAKSGEDLGDALNSGFTDRVKEAAEEYATNQKDIFDLSDATKIEVSDNARQSLDRQIEQVQSFDDAVDETGQNVDELNESSNKLGEIFKRIGSVISTIWDKVSTFVSNISVGQVIIIAFSSALVLLIFNIARTIGEAKEVFEGFGRILKATAGRIWAEAFDQISQALFNVAKAIALLVLVANFDPEGLKQAAIVMGIFLAVITALVIVFSRLVTVTDKLKSIKNAGEAIRSLGSAISKVFGLFSIAMMIAALSFSIMMLTNSLATLSQIDTASLWKGLAVLVILLGTMTAIIFILSKNTVQLTAGTVLIFAYSYALKLFSNALANISDGFSANIQKITSMTFKEIAVLISLVLGLTVLSVYINKASFALSKVILSLTLLAIGFGLVVAVMGIFKDNPLAESLIEAMSDWRLWIAVGATAVVILAAFALVSTQLANVSKKTETDLNGLYDGMTGLTKIFGQLSVTLLIVMGGIAGIMAILSNSISKFGLKTTAASFGMSIAIIASIVGLLVLLVKVFIKAGKDIKSNNIDEKVFSDISGTLRSITGSIIALTITMMALVGASMLFWKQYRDNPWQGILVLGTSLVVLASVMGMIAGAIAVLGQNFKGDNSSGKNILASMIPIIILVGELIGALALFSTFKDPRSLIPGIIAINAVMAPIIGLIAVIAQLGKVMSKKTYEGDTEKLYQSSESLKSIFKILTLIFTSVSVLMAEIAAIAILMDQKMASPDLIAYPMIAVGGIIASIIPILIFLNGLSRSIGESTNANEINKALNKIALIILTVGSVAATLVAGIAGLSYLSSKGGFYADEIIHILIALGAVVIALTGLVAPLVYLSKSAEKSGNLRPIIILLGNISGILALLSGSLFLLKDIPADEFIQKAATLTTAIAIMGGIVSALTMLSKIKTIDASKIYAITATIVAMSIAVGSFGAVMYALSTIDTNKVNQVIQLLESMVIAIGVLGVVAIGLGVAFSSIGGWSGLVIAFFGAMSIVLLSFGAAVNMIANSDLDSLTTFLKSLTNSTGGLSAVGQALWMLVGACTALAIGLTLGGPGILIAAAAFLALAGSLSILVNALSALVIITDALQGLIVVLTQIKGILVPFGIFLGLLTLFAPGILVVSVAINLILVSITLFIGALGLLSKAIVTLTTVMLPFVQTLRESGLYIAEHYKSFVALGTAIAGLGTACAIAAPGLLSLAGAIGIIIVSIGLAAGIILLSLGVALALAVPFIATLTIGFIALTALIISLKDAFVDFVDQMISRMPQIISILQQLAPISNSIGELGGGLILLGVGLLSTSIGLIVVSLGVLALAGALKVLSLVVGSFDEFVAKLAILYEHSSEIETLATTFMLFGLGLTALGLGSLVAAIGLLSIAGALAVLGNVVGSLEDFVAKLTFLSNQTGMIVDLTFTFAIFGLGLTALGLGSLVAGIGLAALAGSIAIFNAIGFDALINAFSRLIELNRDGSIVGFGFSLIPVGIGLIALGVGCTVAGLGLALLAPALILAGLAFLEFTAGIFVTSAAFALFTSSLLALTSQVTGEQLTNIGLGIMMIAVGMGSLASAMLLLGVVAVIISLVVAPIQVFVIVLMMLLGTIPAISASVIKLSTAFKTAAYNIADSILIISNAIATGINEIVAAVSGIMNLAQQGADIAVNLIAGFTGGISSNIGAIGDSVSSIIGAIINPICEALDINSPSGWFKWVADMCTAGFTNGISNNLPLFKKTGEAAGNAAGSGFLNTIKGWFQGSKVGNVITGGINKVKNGINNILGKDNKLAKGWQTVKDIFSGNFNFGDLAGKLGLDKIAENLDFSKATTGLDDFSSGLGDIGTAAQTTKGTLEELTDTIKNQMDIFARFNDEDIIDPKELIHNMESQLRGIRNWANGIDVLASRGASGDLIKYLSELGPQGYKYVESFLEMTGDQFAKANSLFTESLSLPDEAANTLLEGYRKSGAEIVEAVNDGLNQGIGSGTSAAVDTFDSAMTQMKDGASEAGQQILNTAIDKGGMTATAIRTLAGEAGEDAIFYYSEALETWFTSAEYEALDEEMKSKLGNLWQFTASDMMKKAGRNVDTSKTIFDHDYLNKLSQEDGVFYLDGFGKALSSSQYIAKCMEKGGQLLPAVIDDTVKPADLGNTMGLTSIEAAQLAFENGVQDVSDSIADLFNRAYEFSEDYIALSGKDSADTYMDSAVDELNDRSTDLLNAVEETWSSVRDKSKSYNDQMQKLYDQQQNALKQKGQYWIQGLGNGTVDSKTTTELEKSIDKVTGIVQKKTQKGLYENSPSELSTEYGMYWVMGLANGIRNYAYLVSEASDDLTSNPIDSLADTITQISSLFTEDLDAAPTITPILDMSNVESGASELDTLFSTQQAQIAANANVRYTHDDSVNRLKAAYADVLSKSNAELINAIQNTEQPINVNVVLQGDASTFFSAMVDQTRSTVASGGMNPFLITNRNSINAALV